MKAGIQFGVVDLFSGVGGMSCGFARHPRFEILAAGDAEIGKPSMGAGSLQCNATYEANMGIAPARIDLSAVEPSLLRAKLGIGRAKVHVLSVCPPCTGFSRTNPENHTRDDCRNGLVRRAARFAKALDVEVVVMENARELIRGNFGDHYKAFRKDLQDAGFEVHGSVHLLSCFGLPQIRERALIVAVRKPLTLRTLEQLWAGYEVAAEGVTVRAAFNAISPRSEAQDWHPSFSDARVRERLAAIPRDGGSWIDLVDHPGSESLLTGSMKRILKLKRLGSHPDVYGRMAWDRPAPTIKRECAHIGNGRYAHPEEDRLCSVREMAILQGFPNDFVFRARALSNTYRHIGDAVPPLISYQLAHLCAWILTGRRPAVAELILAKTHLRRKFLQRTRKPELVHA